MQLLYLGPPDTLEHVRAKLPKGFEVHFALDSASADRFIQSCDVVLDAYLGVRFPADRLSRAVNLKLFVTATTGADHVDAAVLAKRGIPLLTLRGQRQVLQNLAETQKHRLLCH